MSIGWTERELIKVLVDEISSVGVVCCWGGMLGEWCRANLGVPEK